MKHQWKDLNTLNLFPKLKPHLQGFRIDLKTQKLTTDLGIALAVPWHYVNNDGYRAGHCKTFMTMARTFDFMPSFCSSCWKVCVHPQTLRELHKVREIMLEMARVNPECWCKCGIEMRPNIAGDLYFGCFYSNSKEAALERWHEVRGLVPLEISVTLKHSCTEFEMRFGNPEKYELPAHAEVQEKMMLTMMDTDLDEHSQPPWALLQVVQGWIAYGWRYGTPEDRRQIEKDYNSGNPLYPPSRTYHPGGSHG